MPCAESQFCATLLGEPMAPVGAAERSALEGFFRSRRGQRVLIVSVQDALITYFATKGTTLRELPPRPASATDKEGWLEEWSDIAGVASVGDTLDQRNVVRWIEQEEGAHGGLESARSGKAFAVADALTKKGFTIDRAAELTITAALAAADSGDTAAQCRSVEVIWLLYLGQLPGVEERKLFAEKREACGALEQDTAPEVDIRLFKAYYKQCSATTVPTLERALRDKTGRLWLSYYGEKLRQFNSNGFDKATTRFIEVVGYAREISHGVYETERRYLQYYWFKEHLGKGMPEARCHVAALMAASGAVLEDLRPTVKEDGDSLAETMASMGQWARTDLNLCGQYPRMDPQTFMALQMQAQQAQHVQQAQQAQQMQAMGFPAQAWMGGGMPRGGMQNFSLMGGMGSHTNGGGAGGSSLGDGGPFIEEIEPEKCPFCDGKHPLSKCTQFLQARGANRQVSADKAAAKKAVTDAKKAAAAAAAMALGAGAGAAAAGVPP